MAACRQSFGLYEPATIWMNTDQGDIVPALEYVLSLIGRGVALTRSKLSSTLRLSTAFEIAERQSGSISSHVSHQPFPHSTSAPLYSTSPSSAYLASDVSRSLRRLDTGRYHGQDNQRALEEACWSCGVELYTHTVERELERAKSRRCGSVKTRGVAAG